MMHYVLIFIVVIATQILWICSQGRCSETISLEPIIVTAKGSGESHQTKDVDKTHTSVFYHTIQRDEFEGKMEDVSEVIEKQTGIQVRQTGGLGSFSTVSLRGASSEQVMVYLDGVLLNDASGGGVDLSNISLSDVDSIEIYRGISPVNFNKASIGGVVNIRTRRIQPGFNTSIITGYGSFNAKNVSGFLNHKINEWDYLISGDYLSSDNDFRIKNNNGTPLNPYDDHWENRNNAQFHQENILARVGYDVCETTRMEAINRWFSKNQGIPSWNNSKLTDTDFDTLQNISTIMLIADDLSPLHVNTHTQIDYFTKTETYDDSKGHIGLGNQNLRYTTDRFGASSFFEWQPDGHSMGVELTGQEEIYHALDRLNDEKLIRTQRRTWIMGFQDTVFLLNRRMCITPALRFQNIQDRLKYSADPVPSGNSHENYINPQLGCKYKLSPDLVLKSNLAQYDREPSFFELYGDRGIFVGNPDLKAESGVNFDVGAEVDKEFENPYVSAVSAYSVFFLSDIKDLISRSYDARGIGKSENISDAFIDGIETGLTIDSLWNLRLTERFTWQHTENKSDIIAFNGKDLPGRFKTSWLSKAEYNHLRFKIFIEYIRESGMYYDTANLIKAKTKSEINSGISWLWNSWMLTLDAKNLNNDSYEDFNGYPLPGRSYFFTIKYSME